MTIDSPRGAARIWSIPAGLQLRVIDVGEKSVRVLLLRARKRMAKVLADQGIGREHPHATAIGQDGQAIPTRRVYGVQGADRVEQFL